MTETQLCLLNIALVNLFDDFGEVHSDAAQQLNDSLVVAGSDTGLGEDGLTHVGVADAQSELLLFARFGGWQVGREEGLKS